MTDIRSPREWLRDLLDGIDVGGLPVPEIRRLILPELRVSDVNHWSVPGLDQEIRRYLKQHGMVLTERGQDGSAGSAIAIDQLEFEGIVEFLHRRHEQVEADRESAYAWAEKWCATHPDFGMTADELMKAAGWS